MVFSEWEEGTNSQDDSIQIKADLKAAWPPWRFSWLPPMGLIHFQVEYDVIYPVVSALLGAWLEGLHVQGLALFMYGD